MRKILFIIATALLTSIMLVSCTPKVKEIKLGKSALTLEIGSSDTLSVTFTPAEAEKPEFSWLSSDDKIASVDNSGLIKAISIGNAVITAKTKDGKLSASSNVLVKAKSVKGVKLNKESMTIEVGASDKLQVSIEPNDAGNKKITWTSSNSGVATVDENGNVKGVSAGSADMTVKTEDGSFSAKCVVTVKAKPQPSSPKTTSSSTNNTSSAGSSSSLKVEYNGSQVNFYENGKFVCGYYVKLIEFPDPYQLVLKVAGTTNAPITDFKAVVNIDGQDYTKTGKTSETILNDFRLPAGVKATKGVTKVNVFVKYKDKEYKITDTL